MSSLSAYKISLEDHIAYVRQAGRKIGVSNLQLTIHDDSKYSRFEFSQYANYFYNNDGSKKSPSDRSEVEVNDFAEAWLHHMNHNEHHWQYWIFPDGFSHGTLTVGGVMKMPENFLLEMVADWMGASMAYTGSWDMTSWLKDNVHRIILHKNTIISIRNILADLEYSEVMMELKFKNE